MVENEFTLCIQTVCTYKQNWWNINKIKIKKHIAAYEWIQNTACYEGARRHLIPV